MTDAEKAYATQCVRDHDVHRFYTWTRWEQVRTKVLEYDRHECQMCRSRKKYKRADTVHHVNHLKDRPDLSLEVWYRNPTTHKDERNLISLCHFCHEEVHGFRKKKLAEPLTEERWD